MAFVQRPHIPRSRVAPSRAASDDIDRSMRELLERKRAALRAEEIERAREAFQNTPHFRLWIGV